MNRPVEISITRDEAEFINRALQDYRDHLHAKAERERRARYKVDRRAAIFTQKYAFDTAALVETLNARLFPAPVVGPDPRD